MFPSEVMYCSLRSISAKHNTVVVQVPAPADNLPLSGRVSLVQIRRYNADFFSLFCPKVDCFGLIPVRVKTVQPYSAGIFRKYWLPDDIAQSGVDVQPLFELDNHIRNRHIKSEIICVIIFVQQFLNGSGHSVRFNIKGQRQVTSEHKLLK